MNKNGAHFTPGALLMMAGSVGAGKSTVALALGEHLDWPVIDKDIIKSELLSAEVADDVSAPLAYNLSFAICEELLKQGRSVILDTPLRSPKTLASAKALTRRLEYTLEVIYCEANSELRNERLAERKGLLCQWNRDDRTDASEAQVFDFLSGACCLVDTSLSVDTLVPQIVHYLERVGTLRKRDGE